MNSGDALDGGAGTDSVQAVVNGSVTPASLKNIENVALTAITNAASVDLTNATGLTSVTNQASTSALTVSGFSKGVAATVQDTSTAGQVIGYNDVTGSADAATVTLKNVTGATTLTVAGVETLTLNSTGSVNNVLATLTATSTGTLVVTGDRGLNVGTLGTSIVSVNASNSAVGVTAVMGSTNAAVVTGGAGNDSFTFGSSAGADSIDAGAGNDTIIFTANFTTSDTVNGGDGTDSLRAISADLVTASASTPTTYRVTNIETIQATDALANGATLNAVNVSATATRLNLALTGADIAGAAGTLVGAAGTFTVGLGGAAANNTAGQLENASTLTVADTGAGISDSLTILNSAINTTTGLNINVYDSSNIAVNGYETVTINSGSISGGATSAIGTITVTGDVGGTSAETVVFTGANGVSAGVITADIINASALTAASGTVLDMVTNSTATTITGSAGIDDLHGNTTTGSSIAGGAGNDSVTGGTGNDTLLGEAGNDTITNGGGRGDSVDGGAGNDTVVATLTAGNVVLGGDGTDVLSLAVAATAATASGVSGFETARLSAAITQDMAVFLDNSTFSRLEVVNGVAGVFSNVGAGVTTAATNTTGASLTATRLVDTSSNSINLIALGNATTTLFQVNDEETVNLSTSSATGATTITTLTATDLHTLNITGSNAITIGTLSANSTTAGTTLTINASANTGGVTVSAANSTIVGNITGSSTAANTLTGTAGADTIIGGSAADVLNGGLGSDTLTGGAGSDTFALTRAANSTGGTPSGSVFEVITDYQRGIDVIDETGAALTRSNDASAVAATAALAQITLATAIATFHISDDTLAKRVTAVEAALTAGTEAANQFAVFQFGSDTYVFIHDGTAGLANTDALIKLVGITGITGTDIATSAGNLILTGG